MTNIAKDKIEKLKSYAERNNMNYVEISNGVQVKTKSIICTFYSGPKGTYCIDRLNGKIEKGTGFDRFMNILKNQESKVEIDVKEAMARIKDEKPVYELSMGSFELIAQDMEISDFVLIDAFYKDQFSVVIDGISFNDKARAILYIENQ